MRFTLVQPVRAPVALVSIIGALALSGCSGMNRDGKWPTLAPRAGEISPLVPRTPLGACAGCGQDMIAPPAPPPVAVALPPAPADTVSRLDAIDKAIAEVAAAFPAQRRALRTALAAAAGKADDSNAATEAEVERSRFETLFLPLAVQDKALDAMEDDLAGRAATEAYRERIAGLRARIVTLEADRAQVGY
ncbi:hypothetical protein GCM10011529_28260 [Polymorphobacter glacialis]|uniref:Uncharacterized protein n=1 Tax=Sandarakinorhabdus glacialis TaxID=1614636 RepID=A0A917EBE9_9SPHN|nr:hypothetical protein [Polymorphobacter glacialis]GGE20003.1 hypothetical protein GCM10011529_28260 [Polymorphobacter glacialis]